MSSWITNKNHKTNSSVELRNYIDIDNRNTNVSGTREVHSSEQPKTRPRRKLPTTPNPPTFQTDLRAQRPRVRDVILKYRATTSIGKGRNDEYTAGTESPSKTQCEETTKPKRRILPSTKLFKRDQVTRTQDLNAHTTKLDDGESKREYHPKASLDSESKVSESSSFQWNTLANQSPKSTRIVQLRDISPEALKNITASEERGNRVPLLKWWLSDENLNRPSKHTPLLKRRGSVVSIQSSHDVSDAILPDLRLHNTAFNSITPLQRSMSVGNIFTNSRQLTNDAFFDAYAPLVESSKGWPIPNASVAFREAVTNMAKSEQDEVLSQNEIKTHLTLSTGSESAQKYIENRDTSDELVFSLTGENESTSSSSVGNIARLRTHQRKNSIGGKSADSLPQIHVKTATQNVNVQDQPGVLSRSNSASSLSTLFTSKFTKTKRAPPRSPSSNFIKQYASSAISTPSRKSASPGIASKNKLQRTLSVDNIQSMNQTTKLSSRKGHSPYT